MANHDPIRLLPVEEKPNLEAEFDEFYRFYPRKGAGKTQGKRTFLRLRRGGMKMDHIMMCLANYMSYLEVNGTQRQYIRMVSTFLNNIEDFEERHEDNCHDDLAADIIRGKL